MQTLYVLDPRHLCVGMSLDLDTNMDVKGCLEWSPVNLSNPISDDISSSGHQRPPSDILDDRSDFGTGSGGGCDKPSGGYN